MNDRTIELKNIIATVRLYTEGLRTGNVELLRKAFHPKAMMYGVSPNAVTAVEIDGMYQYVAGNKPPSSTGEPYEFCITAIHQAGNAARVEMVEESAYGNNYTDYFQLLKIDGEWVIVSKAYNGNPSKK